MSGRFPERPQASTLPKAGDGGAHWRAMKVKRIYEQAERDNRALEDVALERFDSLEEFEMARRDWEQKFSNNPLNRRRSTADDRRSLGTSSRDVGGSVETGPRGFRRPSEQYSRPAEKPPATASVKDKYPPISSTVNLTGTDFNPVSQTDLDQAQNGLNRLQAKVLRARMMNSSNLAELELELSCKTKEFSRLVLRRQESESVAVLQPFDSRGRYQDLGGDERSLPKHKVGEEKKTVMELMRNERLEQHGNKRSFDDEYAQMLVKDSGFNGNNLEYLDANADRLSSLPTSANRKRTRAIADYNRFKTAVDRCWYCCGEDRSPQTAVVSSGTRVYLAVPKTLPLVEGHCLIVPMEHHANTLECDDDEWTEIRNYQKCLIRAFHARQQAVVFTETAMQFRRQHHAVIECVPLPWDLYDQSKPAFKTAILSVAKDWSQHRQLIETSRQRGFRRSLVPNLPYFHVWFDPDNGYGHVIEQEQQQEKEDAEEQQQQFPRWFGREVLGGMLQLSVAQWRKPRTITDREQQQALQSLQQIYSSHDWTVSIS